MINDMVKGHTNGKKEEFIKVILLKMNEQVPGYMFTPMAVFTKEIS